LKSNLKLLESVEKIASSKGCTKGQIALAWLYQQAANLGVSMVAIPGTKRVKYLDENIDALEVKLDKAEMDALNATFTPESVAGDRYAVKHLMYAEDE
jgi:aryl-alcohol dehydrogenase-like predicted oxidoreductase